MASGDLQAKKKSIVIHVHDTECPYGSQGSLSKTKFKFKLSSNTAGVHVDNLTLKMLKFQNIHLDMGVAVSLTVTVA